MQPRPDVEDLGAVVRADTWRGPVWFGLHMVPLSTAGIAPCRPCGSLTWDLHVRTRLDNRASTVWSSCSDVLYHAGPVASEQPRDMLLAHPGAAVCTGTTEAGALVAALRRPEGLYVVAAQCGASYGIRVCGSIASALHAYLTTGLHPDLLRAVTVDDNPPLRVRQYAC